MTTMKTKITAALMAAMMVLTIVPFLGAESSYAATDKGSYTMDLSAGPKELKYSDQEARDFSNCMEILEDEGIITYRGEDPVFMPGPSDDVIIIKYAAYYDLNKDGKDDIKVSGELAEKIASDGWTPVVPSELGLDDDDTDPEMAPTITMEKADTCSIKDHITLNIPPEVVKTLVESSESESFYSSVTFVFAKAVPIAAAKKANTLKVKGKTALVKLSKLNKKSQTLSVKKVIKFRNRGQGPLRYKKVSGDKKITINRKTGKVTVKKGLKKGTYKVKVTVKAAGNANYKASAYKPVTFTIKVK